jgi:hypothetical protein
MSQILGTFLDSGGNPITGKLRVTLSGTLVEISATPDSIYLTQPSVFTITDGVVDINLNESETKKITYKFEFFKTDDDDNLIDPALLEFDALVPNSTPIQFANLVPTGMVNDVLDTGALRIAQLIAADPNLSANIGGPFPKGNWSSETTYRYRDLVNYLNRTYISRSLTPTTGILPTNNAYWMNLPLEPTGTLILGDAAPYSPSWSGSGLATSQNAVYTKFEAVNSDLTLKANVSNPTFSGVANFNNTVRVSTTGNVPGLNIQSSNSVKGLIRFSTTGGVPRWEIFKENNTETGSNSGSSLTIDAYDDAGNNLGFCLSITRATRAVNVTNPSAGDNSTRVATTSWVTTKVSTLAPLASPTFTGVPRATTPADPYDDSTRIATTAHVRNILNYYASNSSPTFYGVPIFTGGATFNAATTFSNTINIKPFGIYTPGIDIQSANGSRSCLRFSNNTGLLRWEIFKSQDNEAGSNVGSDFVINRYDDAGVYLDYSIGINRNNGKINLNGATQVFGKLIASTLSTNIVSDFASNSAGEPGDIKVSVNYLYCCTAASTWKRVALSSY